MTLAKVSHTENKCAIGSDVLPSLHPSLPPMSVVVLYLVTEDCFPNQISCEWTTDSPSQALKCLAGRNQEEIKCC